MLRIINEERVHRINRCLVCGKELTKEDNYFYNSDNECICEEHGENKSYPLLHNKENK